MVGELSWVEKLPDDVLTHILSFLSSFELGRVGRVSQRMRLFSSSNLLWQNHITVLLNGVDWHSLTSSPTLLSASTAIRDYYYFLKRQSSFYRTGVFTHKKKLIQSLSSSKRNGQETELKICTLGCMGVGKSTILIQFMCGHFAQEYDPTICDSYRKRWQIYGGLFMLDVLDWAPADTSAKISFLPDCAMTQEFMTSASGIVLVYSITDRKSFVETEEVLRVLAKVRSLPAEYGPSWPAVVLCGNKCDLESDRVVSTAEGQARAIHYGCPFLEITAKDRDLVESIFRTCVLEMGRLRELKEANTTTKDKCLLM
ncbi:GTP-binding protein Rit2 [Pelomyxa schiedti]|nr:GTP-binding protein Rit2 [Pelomyxa schiedti]